MGGGQGSEATYLTRRDLAVAVAVAAAYYALTRMAYALGLAGDGALAIVWPQSGLALAAVLRARRPALVVAAIFVAGVSACLSVHPLPRALAYGLVDALEPALAAGLLRRALGGPFRLRRVTDLAALVVLGAGLGNAATACLGAAIATGGAWTGFAGAWWHWWVADGLGMVAAGGLLLAWTEPDPDVAARPGRPTEAVELLVACALLAGVGLRESAGGDLPFMAFPLLLWPALRFGPRGATAAVATLSLALLGHDLRAGLEPARAAAAQGFLCVGAVCALFPSALMIERRRAEAALRRSQEQLERAQQVAHLGQWVRELDGGVEVWSDELRRLLGLPPTTAPGAAAFLERADAAVGPEVAAAMAGGPDVHDRTLQVRACGDDAPRWLLVRTRADRDASGQARWVVGTFLDVTAPRRAQLALEESEQRYRALFQHAPLGLGVLERDGRPLAVNEAMLEPGGYTREDVATLPYVSALLADPTQRDAVRAMAREGRLDRSEVRLRRRDGGAFDALLTLRPVRVDGRDGCWLAMVEDVTARKQAEAARRRLEEELQHARRLEAVGVFAAGVAHDFNNLLTAIYGYSDIARRRAGDDPGLGEALDGIRDAADQASAVTRSLLAFARKSPTGRETLDLGGLVRDAVRLLRRLVPPSIEVVLDLAPAVWTTADPGQLQQVLMNLVLNGVEAMPGGGRLTITVRARDDVALGGPAAVLVVDDSGGGIAADVLARVFEPFYTTKQLQRGTGLGLAVVHGIVSALGGRVRVETEVGRGTTMIVALPPSAAPPPASTPPDGATRAGPPAEAPRPEDASSPAAAVERGARLAVVAEDDPLVRRALEEGLRDAGLRVRSAPDGEAAAALLEAEPEVALLVLDVDLPGRSGPECLRAARARGVGAPALFVTGNAGRLSGEVARDPRVHVLEKPFDLRRLREVVEQLLDQERA